MAARELSMHYLPFEEPLKAIDDRIRKLQDLSKQNDVDFTGEIAQQVAERNRLLADIFGKLTPWDRIQVARHVHRPQTADYVEMMCQDFLELHGDRHFADDRAILTGLAQIDGCKFMLIGQHKGRDIEERQLCNFGSPQPEGYRKALHKMRLAEKLRLPIVCLIDTKGAAPDIGAEERGQSEAIAYNLLVMSGLRVPIVCIVIGEGGSGGALGIGIGDRFLIQEFAYFSVISPEGCASILWKDPNRKADAAAALKITAPELLKLGVVDGIVAEPLGGAHRNRVEAARMLRDTILANIAELSHLSADELLDRRYQKLRALGKYREDVQETVEALAALQV